MLEVVFGPFGDLEAEFLEKLRGLKAEPLAPVLVAAPSRRLADRLQRLAALEAGLPMAAVEFATFHSLALRIATAAGLDRSVLSDALFYDKLVDGLLAGRRDPNRGRWRGLPPAVRSSIKDLTDAGVEAGTALEQHREGLLGGEDPEFERLLELHAAFEERVSRLDVLSPSGLAKRAADAAPESRWLGSFRAILYYGFYDLTGLQADLFEAVAKSHPTVLFYPYEKKEPYAFARRFFESRLHFGSSPRPAKPKERAAPRVSAFHASGASDELWKTAKAVVRLVEEEGYAYSEIGVVARTLEPYRAHLRAVFDEHSIPFHTTAEEPLLRYPLAKQALSLLTWADRDFPAVAMLDLLGSPFFRFRNERWKALIGRLRIHEGWLQWEGKLESWSKRGEEDFAPREEAAALLGRLRAIRASLADPEPGGWASHAAHARGILEAHLDFSGETGPERDAVESVLERLASYEPLGRATWAEFLETLEEAFRRESLPLSPRANLGVRVLDAMAARGESFRALFLIGLKEKLFPRLIREDPFLRDARRRALGEHAGYWISTKLGGYDEEKLLFRLLTDSARERLTLSFPRSDDDGKAQAPSIYLLELLRERGIQPEAVPLRPTPKLASEAPRLTPKEASLYLALRGADAAPLYERLGWPLEPYRAGAKAADAIAGFGAAGPFDGLTGPSPALESRLARGLAATAVQDLAVCPFRFFASHVLELDEPEQARERKAVGGDVRGEIYHRFLERFCREGERDFRRAADETFEEYGWRSLGVYPLLWKSLREEMEGHLRAFIERDQEARKAAGFRPEKFELELKGPLPGLEVEFKGRADRIDVGPSGFRVVDYKTNLSSGRLQTQLLQSRALQLAFYLELGAASIGLPPAGAELAGIEIDRVAELDAEEWAAVRGTVLGNLSRLIEQLRGGLFFIYPSSQPKGHCHWCSFASACRRSHGPSLSRSRRSPGWAAFASAVSGRPAAEALS